MDKEEVIKQVQSELFAMQDLTYRDFHAKLMPTMTKEQIIGVRMPRLRAFAKEFGKTANAKKFLETLPHRYYEENNLHGLLIEQLRDYKECVKECRRFLPYVDNWATCDMLAVPIVKKHLREWMEEIDVWLHSEKTYLRTLKRK